MDARDDEILTPEEMDTIWLAATVQLKQLLHRRTVKLRISARQPEPLPVDKPAPTPYVGDHKDFVLVRNHPFISRELAQELAEAAGELREWLSRPNGSLSEPMNAMITCSLQERLDRAVRGVEVAIASAERAASDAEEDETEE